MADSLTQILVSAHEGIATAQEIRHYVSQLSSQNSTPTITWQTIEAFKLILNNFKNSSHPDEDLLDALLDSFNCVLSTSDNQDSWSNFGFDLSSLTVRFLSALQNAVQFEKFFCKLLLAVDCICNRNAEFWKSVSRQILNIFINKNFSCSYFQDAIKIFIHVLRSVDNEELHGFASENLDLLKNFSFLIRNFGDFEAQFSIVEVVFLFTLGEKKLLKGFFIPGTEDVNDFLESCNFEKFDSDTRMFLNFVNENLGRERKVFTIGCNQLDIGGVYLCQVDEDSCIWLDVNVESRRLSITALQNPAFFEPDEIIPGGRGTIDLPEGILKDFKFVEGFTSGEKCHCLTLYFSDLRSSYPDLKSDEIRCTTAQFFKSGKDIEIFSKALSSLGSKKKSSGVTENFPVEVGKDLRNEEESEELFMPKNKKNFLNKERKLQDNAISSTNVKPVASALDLFDDRRPKKSYGISVGGGVTDSFVVSRPSEEAKKSPTSSPEKRGRGRPKKSSPEKKGRGRPKKSKNQLFNSQENETQIFNDEISPEAVHSPVKISEKKSRGGKKSEVEDSSPEIDEVNSPVVKKAAPAPKTRKILSSDESSPRRSSRLKIKTATISRKPPRNREKDFEDLLKEHKNSSEKNKQKEKSKKPEEKTPRDPPRNREKDFEDLLREHKNSMENNNPEECKNDSYDSGKNQKNKSPEKSKPRGRPKKSDFDFFNSEESENDSLEKIKTRGRIRKSKTPTWERTLKNIFNPGESENDSTGKTKTRGRPRKSKNQLFCSQENASQSFIDGCSPVEKQVAAPLKKFLENSIFKSKNTRASKTSRQSKKFEEVKDSSLLDPNGYTFKRWSGETTTKRGQFWLDKLKKLEEKKVCETDDSVKVYEFSDEESKYFKKTKAKKPAAKGKKTGSYPIKNRKKIADAINSKKEEEMKEIAKRKSERKKPDPRPKLKITKKAEDKKKKIVDLEEESSLEVSDHVEMARESSQESGLENLFEMRKPEKTEPKKPEPKPKKVCKEAEPKKQPEKPEKVTRKAEPEPEVQPEPERPIEEPELGTTLDVTDAEKLPEEPEPAEFPYEPEPEPEPVIITAEPESNHVEKLPIPEKIVENNDGTIVKEIYDLNSVIDPTLHIVKVHLAPDGQLLKVIQTNSTSILESHGEPEENGNPVKAIQKNSAIISESREKPKENGNPVWGVRRARPSSSSSTDASSADESSPAGRSLPFSVKSKINFPIGRKKRFVKRRKVRGSTLSSRTQSKSIFDDSTKSLPRISAELPKSASTAESPKAKSSKSSAESPKAKSSKSSAESPKRKVIIESPVREVTRESPKHNVIEESPIREVTMESPKRKVTVESPKRKVTVESPKVISEPPKKRKYHEISEDELSEPTPPLKSTSQTFISMLKQKNQQKMKLETDRIIQTVAQGTSQFLKKSIYKKSGENNNFTALAEKAVPENLNEAEFGKRVNRFEKCMTYFQHGCSVTELCEDTKESILKSQESLMVEESSDEKSSEEEEKMRRFSTRLEAVINCQTEAEFKNQLTAMANKMFDILSFNL